MGRPILLLAMMGALSVSICGRAAFAAEAARFELFELTFASDETFDNPFWDVEVKAKFASPDGRAFEVEGFYFGGKEWKVRFVPDALGEWTYSASMGGKAKPQELKGEFNCVASDKHGFLRISKKNPYRFEHLDGTPFYPIGYEQGGLKQAGLDGPGPDGEGRQVPIEEWLKAFDGAANLATIKLCAGKRHGISHPLIDPEKGLDRYDVDRAAEIDEACRLYREYNVALMIIFFQDMSAYGNREMAFGHVRDTEEYKNVRAKNMPLQEKYLRYVVARFGCYADMWELFNEDSYAPHDYLAHLAKTIRDADPYDHPIAANYERPEQSWCEIVCPHLYTSVPASKVDELLVNEIARMKSFGKPIQYTEFGNKATLSNVDPVKWRIAVWTCYIREAGMLFWSMSGFKTVGDPKKVQGNSNAYLGPESRKYFRIHLDFVRGLPVDMRPVNCGFDALNHDPAVRIAALGNGELFVVYLNHAGDHETEVQPSPLRLWTGPGRYKVVCMDPATGETLRDYESGTAQFFLPVSVPPMKVDMAVKITKMKPGE